MTSKLLLLLLLFALCQSPIWGGMESRPLFFKIIPRFLPSCDAIIFHMWPASLPQTEKRAHRTIQVNNLFWQGLQTLLPIVYQPEFSHIFPNSLLEGWEMISVRSPSFFIAFLNTLSKLLSHCKCDFSIELLLLGRNIKVVQYHTAVGFLSQSLVMLSVSWRRIAMLL